MKENIHILRVYNLVNSNGNKLRLYLGRIIGSDDYFGDKGFRWCFVGNRIPMPVRSDTWFNGFPEHIMLDWLKGNGWALHASVTLSTGVVTVCELPSYDEPNKGNEEDIRILPERHSHEEYVFREIIRDLVSNGKRMRAVSLYRYANGGEIRDARNAVMEICNEI